MFNFSNISNKTRNIYLIICFIVLGLAGYEAYKIIDHKNNPPKVRQRVHWKITGMRYIKTDSNTTIGIAEVDPNPVITDMKEGEEINQDANWEYVEKLRKNP